MAVITDVETFDVRFPTSRQLDGSDAMNPDPDYSAAYVTISTDVNGLAGHGFVFTIGRGNEIQCRAIESLGGTLVGRDLDGTLADLGAVWETLVRDSQFGWLGPEKGIIHMAAGAILNALWDLRARREGKPLWLLLAELDPEELVALIDFRHIGDALSPADALAILRAAAKGRADRIARLVADGYPAYTTSSGWLGYDDETVSRLSAEAVAASFDQIKLKVGRPRRRCSPAHARPRRDRFGRRPGGRRQPGLGCRPGDRVDRGAAVLPARVGRGTHEPR